MIITLFGVHIFIAGLMTLTVLQDHRCVRNINCKLCFFDFCLDSCALWFKCCIVAAYIKNIMHNMNCATLMCSREIIYMVLVGQVSELVENLNTGIFSDTVNVISVRLCMMVLYIELYLFITVSVTLTLFRGHSHVKHFWLKIICFNPISSNFVELLSTSSRS